MINLLPPEHKKQIGAARANVILLRYILLIITLDLFMVTLTGFAFIYLRDARSLSEQSITEQTKKEGSYAEVKAQADSFRSELTNAKTILNSQTSYAKAALNIAKLLPPGTALNEIKLNEQSFTTPQTLTVNVTNEQAASQLMNNFKSSPFFSNVTKNKISIGTGSYPYVMDITVTINKAAAQ